MRNSDSSSQTTQLITLVNKMPFFSFVDLFGVAKKQAYLKIFLSRFTKRGKLIRLKKGLYVTADFVLSAKLSNGYSAYTEFVSNILETPSYLSLDYILYEEGLLTEVPNNFTAITLAKPLVFSNALGNFVYHKIKPSLFTGFSTVKKVDYYIARASKAKALFDWLYLRKNSLSDKKSFEELRLNLESISSSDWKELKSYCSLEGTAKMKNIYKMLYAYENDN